MKRIFLTICLSMLLGLGASAQGVLNVRINEVLVLNEENIIDDYGVRESWIEVFNTGFESVDIGGCHIGVRYANRYDADGNKVIRKYSIPKGDPRTKMSSQEFRLFFCEGTDTKGTFYTNFTLHQEKVDMIILYNANGRDVISVFRFPAGYEAIPDVSWGLIGHEEPESYIFPTFTRQERKTLQGDVYLDELAARHKYQPQIMQKSTPGATNETVAEVARHELFRRSDPSGIVMTLTAMAVVFSALILLFLVFKVFGLAMTSRTARQEAKAKGVSKSETQVKTTGGISGEEIAAIGLALQMFQKDLHDKEAAVITINRVGRIYSPWSSKIHGLREIPVKKNK